MRLIALVLVTGLALPSALAAWRNLKVLPSDLSERDLHATMRRMSRALGVGCGHCHVSRAEPALDKRPQKAVARRMIRMVVRLNREDFGYPGAPMIRCMTCHRGQPVPDHTRPLRPLPLSPEGPPAPWEWPKEAPTPMGPPAPERVTP